MIYIILALIIIILTAFIVDYICCMIGGRSDKDSSSLSFYNENLEEKEVIKDEKN